jgi:dihydrofolate reductase
MLKIIVAVAQNGVIGKSGGIPWRLPSDLQEFKRRTGSHPVAMGSRTFDCLPEKFKPLPGRENIVLTRTPDKYKNAGVTVVTSFEEVLARSQSETIFVAGGAELYRLALRHSGWLYLTRVHAKVDGDCYFPDWEEGWERADWRLASSEKRYKDDRNEHNFTLEVYMRK